MSGEHSRTQIPCYKCSSLFSSLQQENRSLSEDLLVFKLHCIDLEKKVKAFEEDSFNWADVDSDYPDPTSIRLSSFGDYLLKVLFWFPFIGTILAFFLSASHKKKRKAASTDPKWILWSNFYQSWLADMFIRSRSPKSVCRTTLMISSFMLLGNIPESCWRLLQRLKIVTTKETTEKWIRGYKKTLKSKSSFLIHCFDNVEIWLKKQMIRSGNKTEIIFAISRYNVEVPIEVHITAAELWNPVERNQFGAWIQSNNDESIEFAVDNWNTFIARPRDQPLKYLFSGTASSVPKSDITFLKPMFDLQTKEYGDIVKIVDQMYTESMEGTDRIFAIVAADWQGWIKLFNMHIDNPAMYHWLVPVPGEWHTLWHTLKGVYHIYYNTILFPFSKVFGFKSLDRECKNFHYGEDLLEMVTISVSSWIEQCVAVNPQLTVIQWLESIRRNQPAYELAYACIHYFVPYWVMRSTLKWNKVGEMEKFWRYWTHLFIACKKNNYSAMCIKFLWVLKSLHPQVKAVYDQHRVVSFSGEAGTGIPFDGLCELVSFFYFPLLFIAFHCILLTVISG